MQQMLKVHLTPVRLFFYLKDIMFIRTSAKKKIDLDKFLIFYRRVKVPQIGPLGSLCCPTAELIRRLVPVEL